METSDLIPETQASPSSNLPKARNKFATSVVAAGAAFAMTLAGLGIANAQTDDTPATTGPSATTPADPAPANPAQADPAQGGSEESGESDRAPRDGKRRRGPGRHHGPGPRLTVAAQTIGISESDLITALREGQSIAQVAQSKGVDPQKVIDAIVAEAQAKAAERAASLVERVTEHVNQTGLRGPDGPRA